MVDFYAMRRLMRQVPRALAAYERQMSSTIGGTAKLSDMPRSPGYNTDRMVDSVIRLQDIEAAYHESIKRLQDMRTELRPYIDRLEDADDQALMRLRYLYGYTIDEIESDKRIPMSKITIWRHLQDSEAAVKKMKLNETK